MQSLPVFLQIKNRPCLVVGAGSVATRKIELLLRAGALVSVVAPKISEALAAMQDRFEYHAREFVVADIKDNVLVIAATNDFDINKVVADAAIQSAVPVNVVDTPELCTFTFGSIIDRDPVTIAISSAGRSPVLARTLKAQFESEVPAAFGKLAEFAGVYRDQVKKQFASMKQRREFWQWVMQGPVAEFIFAGREADAVRELEARLYQQQDAKNIGEVYLVGAGPGDPDLLTFRALRLLQKADVIFYDRLVSQAILDFARRDAEKIYVGKQRNHHCVPQDQINDLLVKRAREGNIVVRLKGGDPFVFGRGGEEAEVLAQNGLDFQIVPGITSASGCAAYAGIPLTHRDHAYSCRFVAGHTRDGKLDIEWQDLVSEHETLVFYMGVKNLGLICERLIEHGMSKDFPAAVVSQGTTEQQKVLTGTLQTLPELFAKDKFSSPGLIIVGRVVSLHDKIAWFNKEP